MSARKTLSYFIMLLFLIPACSKNTGPTTTVVKPKYHHRFFDRKKDKRTPRIKKLKVRS